VPITFGQGEHGEILRRSIGWRCVLRWGVLLWGGLGTALETHGDRGEARRPEKKVDEIATEGCPESGRRSG